jgi:hypothetical protein
MDISTLSKFCTDYKTGMKQVDLCKKYNMCRTTLYYKIISLGLSRPSRNQVLREYVQQNGLNEPINFEVIKIDDTFFKPKNTNKPQQKNKPIKKIPEDMGNYVEITVENTPQKTRKAVARKKIEEHVKRNAEKLHNNPDVEDILADYSGIDEIVKETEKSNVATEKIINKIKSKSKLKKQ